MSVSAIPADARVALLCHGYLGTRHGKLAEGMLRYATHEIVAVVDSANAGVSTAERFRIPRLVPVVASVADAIALGADVLVIAITPSGGRLPAEYAEEVVGGLRAGMSLVNSLHRTMSDDPQYADHLRADRWIWDVRQEPPGLGPATGKALGLHCRRVLTVGTDMAIGKMTASLELDAAARRRGLRSRFAATGQVGMCISGEGVPLDGVRVDYATGAIEALCLRLGADADVLWIEGQGSILHPGSTAWLGLMRGSQPTHLVLVHRAYQRSLITPEGFAFPPLSETIAVYESVAGVNLGFSRPKVVAIAMNTADVADDAEAREVCEAIEAETGLPSVDVVRFGADRVLDAALIAP
jgi:uncharacterized NAD-dependent epimerase/dehydratase family protein